MIKKIFLTLTALYFVVVMHAQYGFSSAANYKQNDDSIPHAPANWFNLDFEQDGVVGVSTERAYRELLKNKKSKPVIVAIIDSGVDTEHEDIKDKLWTNTKEIAGNGKDDDKNGYIDDIHGWNFIGNTKGDIVENDNLELTRLYAKYKKLYDGKSESDFKGKKLEQFKLYKQIKEEYDAETEDAKRMIETLGSFWAGYNKADSVLKIALKKDDYTEAEVKQLPDDDENIKEAKQIMALLQMMGINAEELVEGYKHYENQLKYSLNTEFDSRSIVGDDYNNKKEKYYGNNKVDGINPKHGTHVAGIIAANRNNNIGIKGIADNVKIMVIRTVPDGDERDKDVANSIYYAVNNGAKIINMSFGKDYSPYKKYVDKAVKYAEKKGVLIVHAAGNDGRNTDEHLNYPHPKYQRNGKWAKNWIEVGASSWEKNEEMPANFSNYGKKTVSLFAPGVEIYSSIPGNKYETMQGTSMACPVVAGVAALVLSYYPNLKAEDLKTILLKSSTKYPNLEVLLPGFGEDTMKFSELSSTGGVVNAYNALKMAANYKK